MHTLVVLITCQFLWGSIVRTKTLDPIAHVHTCILLTVDEKSMCIFSSALKMFQWMVLVIKCLKKFYGGFSPQWLTKVNFYWVRNVLLWSMVLRNHNKQCCPAKLLQDGSVSEAYYSIWTRKVLCFSCPTEKVKDESAVILFYNLGTGYIEVLADHYKQLSKIFSWSKGALNLDVA